MFVVTARGVGVSHIHVGLKNRYTFVLSAAGVAYDI